MISFFFFLGGGGGMKRVFSGFNLFFGNFIFALIAQTFSGNHLNLRKHTC